MSSTSSGYVIASLLICAIVLLIAIEFTYSETVRNRMRHKHHRMQIRGLFYVLLVCVGIVLLVTLYMVTKYTPRCANTAIRPSASNAAVDTQATGSRTAP